MQYGHRNNSLSNLLIATLFSARNSRTFHEILRDRAIKRARADYLRTTLHRLKNKNILNLENGKWSLAEEGKNRMREHERFSFIPSPFPKNAPDGIIVSFDVSQQMRRERTWLRNQLKIFGFRMLHQSLWIGPAPLPDKFNKKILALGLKKCIKTFKLAKQ